MLPKTSVTLVLSSGSMGGQLTCHGLERTLHTLEDGVGYLPHGGDASAAGNHGNMLTRW